MLPTYLYIKFTIINVIIMWPFTLLNYGVGPWLYIKFYPELYHTVLPFQLMLTNKITGWMIWLVYILCNSISASLSHSDYCTYQNSSCWIPCVSTEPFKYKVYAVARMLFNLNSHCGTFSLLDKRDVRGVFTF